jgi:hypothetical protein
MAKKKALPKLRPVVRPEIAPLNSLWFVSSILGMIISIVYVSKFSLPWAAAFTVVFASMFFAGIISMRRAMPDDQLLPRPKRSR